MVSIIDKAYSSIVVSVDPYLQDIKDDQPC